LEVFETATLGDKEGGSFAEGGVGLVEKGLFGLKL